MKAVDGGRRAPGCVVKGCGRQPRRGAKICKVHAEVLRQLPAGSVRPIAPAEPATADSGHPDGLPIPVVEFSHPEPTG